MASWTRARPVPSVATPDDSAQRSVSLAELPGELPCTQPACEAPTGLACEYVDRRGRACRTAWCPDHRLVIDSRVYCRRHAGVVSALPIGLAGPAAPIPDLENRAPSLVSWVAREIDADVRQMLLAELAPGDGAQLVTDAVYLVFTGGDRRRAWERAWKLVNRGGRSLRVSLLVEECADAEVAVRVNTQVIERLAPPWIVQRQHGAQPPPELDAQRRKEFNRRIFGIIRKGIDREPEWRSLEAALRPRGTDQAGAAGWPAAPSAPLS